MTVVWNEAGNHIIEKGELGFSLEDRIFSAILSADGTTVTFYELCDEYYKETLDKRGMDELITALRTLRCQME